jgi:hypothetical protein
MFATTTGAVRSGDVSLEGGLRAPLARLMFLRKPDFVASVLEKIS